MDIKLLKLGNEENQDLTNLKSLENEYIFSQRSNPSADARIIAQGKRDSRSLEVALTEFSGGVPLEIRVPLFLEDYRKITDKNTDFTPFLIRPDLGTGRSHKIELSERWYDSPYSFVLYYGYSPCATISFRAAPEAILITQIQGFIGVKDELKPLKWGKALIELCCIWAADNEIPEVQVLPHYRNSSPAAQKTGVMNYDVPAKANKFKFDSDKDLYRKIIDKEVYDERLDKFLMGRLGNSGKYYLFTTAEDI